MLKYSGFTLLELIIVIVIISILLFIALPRFRGMDEEAKIAQAKGGLGVLQTALESYYIYNKNIYPTNLNVLITTTPNIIGPTVPKDPFSVAAYGYMRSAGNKKYYVIYSIGPGLNGSAIVDDFGTVTETNGTSCIYVSNGSQDTQP